MHTRCMFEHAAQGDLPVVLLIDDDLVSREVTATLLTMNGYSVHTAESGAASLKLLKGSKSRPRAVYPDVILMDAQMPGVSGTKLIAQLRAHTRARIYAISGSPPPPDVAAATDGFLMKPFDAEAVHKLLDCKESEAPPANIDPNEPVVSVEILSQLRKLMPESALRQIYTVMVADLSRRIEALGAAISKGDAAEVHRIGHAIKGGCGMAGALQAAHLGELLETAPLESKDNHLDNSAALVRDLRAAVRGLKRMLEAELPA
jgi:CheY-like chemotaxis protein